MTPGNPASAALTYARSFFCVVPTLGGLPAGGWGDASRHIPEVEWLFSRRRHDGVGLSTGEASGCWGLIIDRRHGRQSLRTLIDRYAPLPFGPVMATPESWVWFFAWEPGCSELQDGSEFMPGLMIRSEGSGLVVPPGPACRWRDVSIVETEPAAAPEWLLWSALRPARSMMTAEA